MKRRFTEDSWRKEPWFRSLCAALLSCRNEREIADMLRDVGTLSELQAWSERMEVARLLGKGLSYRQVAKLTGASTTTVTRVAHFLENGEGGYRKVLNVHRHHRMKAGQQDGASETHIESSLPESLPQRPSSADAPRKSSSLQKYLDQATRNGSGPMNV